MRLRTVSFDDHRNIGYFAWIRGERCRFFAVRNDVHTIGLRDTVRRDTIARCTRQRHRVRTGLRTCTVRRCVGQAQRRKRKRTQQRKNTGEEQRERPTFAKTTFAVRVAMTLCSTTGSTGSAKKHMATLSKRGGHAKRGTRVRAVKREAMAM